MMDKYPHFILYYRTSMFSETKEYAYNKSKLSQRDILKIVHKYKLQNFKPYAVQFVSKALVEQKDDRGYWFEFKVIDRGPFIYLEGEVYDLEDLEESGKVPILVGNMRRNRIKQAVKIPSGEWFFFDAKKEAVCTE